MPYFVLAVWVIQAAVGVSLFVSWWRHGRRQASTVVIHTASMVSGLALWITFVASGMLWAAWFAFVTITLGNVFGDIMLVRRYRRTVGASASYGAAIGAVLRGKLPPRVVFHGAFAGVVYFSCLGVCIGATVAAATAGG